MKFQNLSLSQTYSVNAYSYDWLVKCLLLIAGKWKKAWLWACLQWNKLFGSLVTIWLVSIWGGSLLKVCFLFCKGKEEKWCCSQLLSSLRLSKYNAHIGKRVCTVMYWYKMWLYTRLDALSHKCVQTQRSQRYSHLKTMTTDKYMILHSEEYFDLYMSPGVSTLLKRRRLRCAGNFARVG